MLFRALVDASAAVARVSGRLDKIARLAGTRIPLRLFGLLVCTGTFSGFALLFGADLQNTLITLAVIMLLGALWLEAIWGGYSTPVMLRAIGAWLRGPRILVWQKQTIVLPAEDVVSGERPGVATKKFCTPCPFTWPAVSSANVYSGWPL